MKNFIHLGIKNIIHPTISPSLSVAYSCGRPGWGSGHTGWALVASRVSGDGKTPSHGGASSRTTWGSLSDTTRWTSAQLHTASVPHPPLYRESERDRQIETDSKTTKVNNKTLLSEKDTQSRLRIVVLSLHSLQVQKDLSPVVPQSGEVRVRSQELLRELQSFFIQLAITPLRERKKERKIEREIRTKMKTAVDLDKYGANLNNAKYYNKILYYINTREGWYT